MDTKPEPYHYHCAPLGFNADILQELKAARLDDPRIDDKDQFALALVDCLKDTRSEIRDGIGYEALTFLMRSEQISGQGLLDVKAALLGMLASNDPAKIGAPFAALVLSEVARTDRVKPWMSEEQRSAFVVAAADYVRSVSDYRGYIDGEGWRHGVAHGADWLMQLSLNEKVADADLSKILDSIAAQIKADGQHAYIHGEPDRLARPVIFVAQRGHKSSEEWETWLTNIADPEPFEKWSDIFKSESGLAQRHNVKAFLGALYVNAQNSENENVRALLPGVKTQMKTIL